VSPLDPDRWRTLRPLLDELLETPEDARPAALARLCGDDAALRADLEALLAADAAAERAGESGGLERPADAVARGLLGAGGVADAGGEAERWIGRALGPYRIVRLLGEGGMGIVFEAEQQDPKRAVALKLVRGGAFLDDARLRLFRREIEALARLQHPSIAPIHGAGRTDDGQHYFAMELVRGAPLDAYLRRRPLSATDPGERAARIALFLEICDAIAYAHQRGVIHRDLKPSNVVVEDLPAETGSGSRGARVKVLDFGLARITDGDVALSTRRTEPRAIEGTLPYMSPEQARGVPDAIDLRSDVYSLGVLLYEMLTGALPYELPRGALHDALRIIGETPPRRPSQRLRALRGDLEVILLKALEKEPAARYASVWALADDLRRALDDQPIAARPPSAVAQLRRFARRHRTAAVFSAALAVVLLLGAAGTTVGMLRARAAEHDARRLEAEAREEARTAESVSRFLVGLFEASDPDSARAEAAAARQLLERGAHQLETSLQDEPRVRARLYHTLGTVHRNLGLYPQARELLARAIELRRAALGPRHPDVATSEYVLAGLLRRLGAYDSARVHYQSALDIRLAALGPDHRDVAGSCAGLANLYIERGEYALARPLCEQALATIERAVGRDDPAVTTYLFNLALLLRQMDDLAGARPLLERAVALSERQHGPDHPIVGDYRFVLGTVQVRLGESREGIARMRQGLASIEKAYGPDHAVVAEALGELAEVQQQAGDARGALASGERALAALTRAVGPDYVKTAIVRDQVALALRDLGRAREAVASSERALRTLEAAHGPHHRSVGLVLLHLAGHHEALGERGRAHVLYVRAAAALRAALGSDHPETRQAEAAAARTG
jgi:serine/threonine protein kinase